MVINKLTIFFQVTKSCLGISTISVCEILVIIWSVIIFLILIIRIIMIVPVVIRSRIVPNFSVLKVFDFVWKIWFAEKTI